jgi:hypothetical protein
MDTHPTAELTNGYTMKCSRDISTSGTVAEVVFNIHNPDDEYVCLDVRLKLFIPTPPEVISGGMPYVTRKYIENLLQKEGRRMVGYCVVQANFDKRKDAYIQTEDREEKQIFDALLEEGTREPEISVYNLFYIDVGQEHSQEKIIQILDVYVEIRHES